MGGNFAKEMDAKNKEFNDAINKVKSDELNLKRQKEFNNLMNKIKRDKIKRDRLKNDTNRTNQTDEIDQMDEDELELIKAKLALGNLKSLSTIDLTRPIDLSISRPPDTTRVKNTPKIQIIEDTLNSIKKNPKELEENEKYGPGIGFAIRAKEIENAYNDINILDDKLNNNNLTLAEYKKIIDIIDQLKKNIPKKEQEIYELKKGVEKRIRTNQAKYFKDQNK